MIDGHAQAMACSCCEWSDNKFLAAISPNVDRSGWNLAGIC